MSALYYGFLTNEVGPMIDIEKSCKGTCEFHAGMKKCFSDTCKTGVGCHEFPARQGAGRSMFFISERF